VPREIDEVAPGVWEIRPSGGMRVPARIYATDLLLGGIRNDQSLIQACNVAHLPGIVQAALAMPDMHEGYGFPIGGVAAFDLEDGVVSPGGVGYDINCGVRLMRTSVPLSQAADRVAKLVREIQLEVPAGVGSEGAIPSLDDAELAGVLRDGAAWAVRRGYGTENDLVLTEAGGMLPGADPAAVSGRARERGAPQLGTLGSGNHFIEIQVVEEVLDPVAAEAFGLVAGDLAVLLHSGSRGLGYQVCDDALAAMHTGSARHRLALPDPQLVAVPAGSPEGRRYLAAMRAAANFAWANRQVMMALVERAFSRVLGGSAAALGFGLVYDIAHNIAKVEEHSVDGKPKALLVHRKGATRAFAAGHPEVPSRYAHVGQPVLIPGDMGRSSFVCVGTAKAMRETFGSAAHGAGRQLSRTAARRRSGGRDLVRELASKGISVAAHSPKTLAEEMPEAYKNAADVVDAMRVAGIATPVVRLRPVGVVKG
jgi:tRNA-splicing ligase RtcB (3'-phosphate/5'-hydroxy nucleic acid ligase)